ncbi:hypothetical protein Tco_1362059 [Tanacetum coccineum]
MEQPQSSVLQQITPADQLVNPRQYQLDAKCNNKAILLNIPCPKDNSGRQSDKFQMPMRLSVSWLTIMRSHILILGYQGILDKVSAFYTKNLAQPWQTMFKVFNRCLTTRLTGYDQTKIKQKKNIIQYPRFTKLIIDDIMEKFESIHKRLEEDYHTIKDDTQLVNVYTTREVTVHEMMIPNDLLTDKKKRKGTQVAGETSSPRKSLKIRFKQQNPISTTPIPPSDDRERDEIIEASQLSISLEKTAKVYEEQQNVAVVEETLLEEDVEKIVEGDDDLDGTEFADTVLLSDEDSGDMLEPGSHKENPKKNDDDVEKKDYKKDADDDDHTNHALIRTQVPGSLEIRTQKMHTPIPSPPRSPRINLSSDKAIDQ